MDKKYSRWGSSFTNPPQSFWTATTSGEKYPSLKEDINVDVVVVGGGIVGITTAFLLKHEGLRVAVIEADRILHATTAHTTAKVTSQHNLIYHRIKTIMGQELARQYAEANQSAIDMIESLVNEKKIECDFHRCPAYVYTQESQYVKKIQYEAQTTSTLGIKSSYHDELLLPFPIKAALRFDHQARFHVLKYLYALAKDIPGGGSYIFEQTRAIDIHQEKTPFVSTLGGAKVSADKIIIATHFPFYDGYGLYFTRLYPDRSYLLGVRINGDFPDGMFISAEDPGRSLRSQPEDDGELVLVGGEHHKTGQGPDTRVHYENLMKFAENNFKVKAVPYRWSTHDYTTADEVPYIGHLTSKNPKIYVATGFGKWGMTSGTVAAMLFKDMIVHGNSPWQDVYNPSRFTPSASAKNFVIENADVAKHLVKGKFTPVPHDVNLDLGEGKVIEVNGRRTGAFKDEKGILHLVDTTCPHMGCELQWNAAERSWDCPCHGSRFTYEGEIIEGPALRTLKKDDQNED